ncbi:MAG: MBL fold metallo-hydrolase [Spirochaetaceae bacterium]|nr:MAG: MBL fold metallo-hydrolase [Spirochaetaceae bacterium]
MKIKIWGCRGSIPSPGCDTNVYGGNTTCVEVRLEDGSLIVIDAGTGMRCLGIELLETGEPKQIHLLLTHAHWDHLQGFPFFVPAYLEGYSIIVRGGPRARKSLEGFLAHQLDPPYFPVPFRDLKARFDFQQEDGRSLSIGGVEILPIPLKHPNGGYGYKFIENGKTFVFLTDNEIGFDHPGGLSDSAYADLCRNADLLLHDGQYTQKEYEISRGWGHSTFEAVTELGITADVRRMGIFHHDPRHLDQDLDRYIEECRQRIVLKKSRVECFGTKEGMEISL